MATYSYSGQEGDLSFARGDTITVLSKDGDWWTGEIAGVSGVFPSTYVQPATEHHLAPVVHQAAATEHHPAPVVHQAAATEHHLAPVVHQAAATEHQTVAAMPSPTTSKRLVGRVVALFEAQQAGQLNLSVGQLVLVRQQQNNGWWEGELQTRGHTKQAGWFPANRIQLFSSAGNSGSLKPVPRVPRSVSDVCVPLSLSSSCL